MGGPGPNNNNGRGGALWLVLLLTTTVGTDCAHALLSPDSSHPFSDDSASSPGHCHCQESDFACWADVKTPDLSKQQSEGTHTPQCANCIPRDWMCDGDVDCEGGEDEAHCSSIVRGRADAEAKKEPCIGIWCPGSHKCVRDEEICNGEDDCGDGWDERECGFVRNCTVDEFQCDNGQCVQMRWLCDGDNDCHDLSDERNCTYEGGGGIGGLGGTGGGGRPCGEGEHHCGDGSCISANWKCDHESDCNDRSDEIGCHFEQECAEEEFRCAMSRCIRSEFRCDGDDDCGDRSDEEGCGSSGSGGVNGGGWNPGRGRESGAGREVGGTCAPTEFRCNNSRCIPERWRCDEENDCADGDDEVDCAGQLPRTCWADEVLCKNGLCIAKLWLCDGDKDCVHGDDEDNCTRTCEEGHFACPNNSMCLAPKKVCDGHDDCPDGSDEESCPRHRECTHTSRCEHLCVSTLDGRDGCSCRPGYRLDGDGYSCLDVDECSEGDDDSGGGVCSQQCRNTIGSFQCWCVDGYVSGGAEGRNCKAVGPPATLLFANRVDIRQVSLDGAKLTSVLDGLQNAIALDYHYQKGMLFWSDVSLDLVKRAYMNGTGVQDVVKTGLESPGGIALDWVHDLLFWTDSGTGRIEVSALDGRLRRVIVHRDLEKPRAIVVHPGEALVFWTDWGARPRVERAGMDGSGRSSIVVESVFWPNGLTLDYATDRLYWVDAKHHVVESSDLNGGNRRKVLSKGLPHPFALTVFEDSLFWTDWHTKSISTASRLSGQSGQPSTLHAGLHFPMDIHSYHPQRQPRYPNRCASATCSHLCLPSPSDGFSCACPAGLELLPDGSTCSSRPDGLLLFARGKDVRLLPVAVDGGSSTGSVDNNPPEESPAPDVVVPLEGVLSAVAVAWDEDTDSIYWTDVEADSIGRAAWNGSQQETIVSTNLESPAGLAVDWLSRKLYWTDAGTNRIEVSNLDGSYRCLLIWEGLDRPRDIAVDPLGRRMYWSDWGALPKIERAGMDGTGRSDIVLTNLTWPNGLAIDHENGRLYWADGGTKTIEFASLDGSGRTVLIGSSLPHPFGLTLYGADLYWTDWHTASIHSTDKLSGSRRKVVRSGLDHLMDVRALKRNRAKIPPNPCAPRGRSGGNRGRCSHLCLLAPGSPGFTCVCPTGIQLKPDGRTCEDGPSRYIVFSHRVDLRRISFDVPYRVDTVLPLPPLKNAIALDVDIATGDLYWSDTASKVIQRGSADGSKVTDVVTDGLDTVDGIAVDVSGRKLYWTDAGRKSIEVRSLDKNHRRVLVWLNLDKPRAIALWYTRGLMFWTDWGQARIEQADMDGGNRKTLLKDDLQWPNGLAVDTDTASLFWVDAKTHTVESYDLDQKKRNVLLRSVRHPYGLTVMGDHVFWTDWQSKSLHRADKTGANQTVLRYGLTGLMDVKSVQPVRIDSDACLKSGCSHLCLRVPSGYKCACPTGIRLSTDGRTCNQTPDNYLLFASRMALARISLDTDELWDVTLPVHNVTNVIAVDFHWRRQLIFYTDITADVICSVDARNLSDVRVLVESGLKTPNSLAVDWLADNIYWIDGGQKSLEVARLDGSSRRLIVRDGLDEPRALAVFPAKGYLFWTDWGKEPKIERSALDGGQRKVIVGTQLGWPNGLALDYDSRRLYWVDAFRDRIETSDLSGRSRVQLVQPTTHPFGLTQFGPHLYWTDWHTKSIERVDKNTGKGRVVIQTDLDGLMEIRAVSADRQKGYSPCGVRNGGCSHLCLFRGKDYVCACPDQPDRRTCSEKPTTVVPVRPEGWDEEEDAEEAEEEEESRSMNPSQTPSGGKKKGVWINRTEGGNPESKPRPRDPVISGKPSGVNNGGPTAEEGWQTRQVVSIVGVSLALAATGVALLWLAALRLKKRWLRGLGGAEGGGRGNNKRYQQYHGRSVLTFSNPNYNASNPDVASVEKKAFSWRKLRYDRSEERVYDLHEEKQGSSLEEAALICGDSSQVERDSASTPPSTPLQRRMGGGDIPSIVGGGGPVSQHLEAG